MAGFSIKTLGCKVNQYDSEFMRERLIYAGYKEALSSEQAVCIINTCTVTAQSDRKSRQMIRKAVKENPDSLIVVTGCLADASYEEMRALKGVGLVLKNKDKEQVAEKINGHLKFQKNSSKLGRGRDIKLKKQIADFGNRTRAFIKVQDGCESFCAYCKIPYVRGKEISRDFLEIAAEVKSLRDKGYKEVVLTGIHLGHYHYQGKSLADLIRKLEKIDGICRLRLSSIELKDFSSDLISALSESEKVCPNFHIPLQSGSNFILKRMNRNYTIEDFKEIISKIKSSLKKATFTTDVIVGFPGETEADFKETTEALKQLSFHRVHVFPFSKRKGTKAYDYQEVVEVSVIKDRLGRVKREVKDLSLKHYKSLEGKIKEVLLENKNKEGCFQGYTKNYERIVLKGKGIKSNTLVKVYVEKGRQDYGAGLLTK